MSVISEEDAAVTWWEETDRKERRWNSSILVYMYKDILMLTVVD